MSKKTEEGIDTASRVAYTGAQILWYVIMLTCVIPTIIGLCVCYHFNCCWFRGCNPNKKTTQQVTNVVHHHYEDGAVDFDEDGNPIPRKRKSKTRRRPSNRGRDCSSSATSSDGENTMAQAMMMQPQTMMINGQPQMVMVM
jgi:hypothetical protein